MSEVLNLLATLIPMPYLTAATTIIAASAAVSAAFPQPKSAKLAAVMKLVNLLALNVANAKNASAPSRSG